MAKANNLELELVNIKESGNVSSEYKKINALEKVPSFEGADGYVLTEAIAIAIYRTYCGPAVVLPSSQTTRLT